MYLFMGWESTKITHTEVKVMWTINLNGLRKKIAGGNPTLTSAESVNG